MPKINVYLPDELAEAVKEAGIPVSAVCQRALEQAVRQVTAIREAVLADLDVDDPAGRLSFHTARSKAALKLAMQRARDAGASEVGTEHLLDAIIATGNNLAIHVLRAVEIEPNQVTAALSRRVSAAGGSGEGGSGEGEAARFSREAANALEMAVGEAHTLGHNYVGCEHLLLGLIAEPDGAGGHVLRSLGAELRLTRRAVVAALAGYVHLRAQTAQAARMPQQPAAGDPAQMVAAVVQQAIQPLLQRIERLERRADTGGGPE